MQFIFCLTSRLHADDQSELAQIKAAREVNEQWQNSFDKTGKYPDKHDPVEHHAILGALLRIPPDSPNFLTARALGDRGDLEVLNLSATNMGPVEITLTKALIVFQPRWFAVKSYGILNVLPGPPSSSDCDVEYETGGGPFAGGFPRKLAVGEQFSVYLVPNHETLARGDYQRIGFDDSFGRSHWAPRRHILEALPYIREACEGSGKNGVSYRSGDSVSSSVMDKLVAKGLTAICGPRSALPPKATKAPNQPSSRHK